MARRGRVGFGQPDMEGHEAGLGPETDKGERKRHGRGREPAVGGGQAQGVEAGLARARPQQDEKGDDAHRAEMRGHEVDPGCLPDLGFLIVVGDEEKRGQGHQFPGDEEKDRVPGGHDQDEARQEQVVEEPVGAGAFRAAVLPAQGGRAGNGARRAKDAHRQQEQAADRVEPQGERADGKPPGQGQADGGVERPAQHGGERRQAAEDRARRTCQIGGRTAARGQGGQCARKAKRDRDEKPFHGKNLVMGPCDNKKRLWSQDIGKCCWLCPLARHVNAPGRQTRCGRRAPA